MYYVTTKTDTKAKTPAKIRVLSVTAKRDTARTEAGTLGGTVRTEAEINALIEASKLDLTTLPGYVAPEPAPKAKTLVELAKEIKAKNHERRTVGKKVKTTKRVVTPEAAIAEAVMFAREQMAAGLVKVALVKALAAWTTTNGEHHLQRRDMFTVLREVGAEVADATIATQFQIVRAAALAGK